MPPADALSEFVEKFIAPPIKLPELRIADQMPAKGYYNDHSSGCTQMLTKV